MINTFKKQINLIAIVLFFKLLILFNFPLTGDEAYFIQWAKNLDIGYYDHPPMVGWLIYLMSFISESFIFYRFFSFFTVLIVAYMMYKLLREFSYDKDKSALIALLFIISPLDVLLVLFTNDVPLMLFGFIGSVFYIYSLKRENSWLKYSILGGIFLGLSFLSKYFTAFLMISLVLYSLFIYKTKALKNVALTAFIIIFFIALNLYYNYTSCWNNILFNFFARTEDKVFSLSTVLQYFAFIIYFLAPWGIYYLIKRKKDFKFEGINKLLVFVLGLIFLVFLSVSLKNKVGLHWFLLFLPFIYLVFVNIETSDIKKIFTFNFYFSLIHIAILLFVVFMPIDLFKDKSAYKHLYFFTKTESVCKALDKYDNLFTLDYTASSVLEYTCKKEIWPVFNNNKYGRLSDKLFDVRTLDEKDIYIFDIRKIDNEDIEDGMCKTLKVEELAGVDAKMYIAKCDVFSYDKYKEKYLKYQKEMFYNIPEFLPVGKCYFNDRYFK